MAIEQEHLPAKARTTMKAIVQTAYGEAPDVLRLAEIDRPEIAANEVLLRVHAAGVDKGAWHLMAGLPYPIRLAGYGLRAPKTPVRGREVAGRVEVLGKDVTTFRVGDLVYGIGEGCFAEYAHAMADKLAPSPTNLTMVQAATVPISALTALQAVRDHGRVTPGQKVLVIGASGGVGTFAVQIGKAYGAEVTGVCSTSKVDLVRSLGADHVVDYTRDDLGAGDVRYDVVLDIGGNRPLKRIRKVLTTKGTLVIVGGETDGRWFGGTGRLLRAVAQGPFVSQTIAQFVNSENGKDLPVLTKLIEAGKLTPAVGRTFPLAQTADAIQYLQAGHARGKVVITVS